MFELPLFPLKSVLFPGTPIQLHIFEERYKAMMDMCIQKHLPFGVVLIQRGVEALGSLAEPYSIGCTAQIIHVQRLEEGRMNIVALGRKRFRILSIDRGTHPYLMSRVQEFPLAKPFPKAIEGQVTRLHQQVERFIQVVIEAGGGKFDAQQLPQDPVALAYVAAALLQVPPEQKQQLLALDRAEELLVSVQSAYRKELALLQATLSGHSAQMGSFSQN